MSCSLYPAAASLSRVGRVKKIPDQSEDADALSYDSGMRAGLAFT